MVMNGEIGWLELYKIWQQKLTAFMAAQKTLDESVSAYLEAEGPPPNHEVMGQVEDLREQMLEARKAVDEFIFDHATPFHQKEDNLPPPDASLDKS